MKTQSTQPLLPLFLGLVGLGLVILAGDCNAQTPEEGMEKNECLSMIVEKVITKFQAPREARAMVEMAMPKVMMMMKKFRSEGGGKKMLKKMEGSVRMCACKEENPDDEEMMCKCHAELEQCCEMAEEMYNPNSNLTAVEIKAKMNEWTECVGDSRLVSYMSCHHTVLSNPLEMMCDSMKCSHEHHE